MHSQRRILSFGLAALTVVLTALPPSAASPAPQTGADEKTPSASPDSVMERSLPSMALVLSADEAGRPVPVACAFVRRPDGVLLTSLHAVKNAHRMQVTLANGEVYDQVDVIAFDEQRDAAALRIPASRLPVIPASASEELKPGDAVYAMYGSAARAWVIVPGLFRAVRMSDEVAGASLGHRLLEFTPPISPRLSGGVLLNAQGQALGLLVSFPGALNAGYAVPLESIAGLADASPRTLPNSVTETLLAPAPTQPPIVAPKPPDLPTESKTAIIGNTPLAKKMEATDILRVFASYYIKSDTIYMHPGTLQKELDKRPEFSAWGLRAIEERKAADVVIVITLPFLTWEWNYRMVHEPTGTVLGSGKVSAAVEKTAAPQLAKMIVERIRTARPLPASYRDTLGALQAAATSMAEKEKMWKAKYVSGTGTIIPKDASVTLSVSRGRISVRTSKGVAFSVPAANVRAADSFTQVRKGTAKKAWEDFWGGGMSAGDSAEGAAGALMLIPIIFLGDAILTPINTTDHFVSIYWLEDGAVKGAEFQASAEDAKSLLAELNKVTGKAAENVEELAKSRQKLITEEFFQSPIVEVVRPVNIGWHALPAGQYRLIVVPRERELAEVYFFPANKPLPDFRKGNFRAEDAVIQGVAELERRKTPLEGKVIPSVSYREQNGIITLSQIETGELILRFTPIPLEFAK